MTTTSTRNTHKEAPMHPTNEMIALAANRLGIDRTTAGASWSDAPGLDDACIFTDGSGRGARQLLVTCGLETLSATSGVSPARLVDTFHSGMRS